MQVGAVRRGGAGPWGHVRRGGSCTRGCSEQPPRLAAAAAARGARPAPAWRGGRGGRPRLSAAASESGTSLEVSGVVLGGVARRSRLLSCGP